MLVSRDLGLDGVSYYSKQIEDDRFAHMISVNLALFAKYNGEKRFSEICSDIEIVPSYNYAMYKQLRYGAKYNNYCDKLHINDSRCLKNVGSFCRQNAYRDTEFYEFDGYLSFGIAPEIEKINLKEENN